MIVITDDDIKKLQSNLRLLRMSMGWSLETFSKHLGVSKQSVLNYENGNSTMKKLQYIAFRSVIYDEYNTSNNNVLIFAVDNILEKENPIEADKNKLQIAIAYVQNAKLLGLDNNSINIGIDKIFKEELI